MKVKIGCLLLAGLLSFGSMLAFAAESPWAAYRFAPGALKEIDLASDTEWTLSIDGAVPRPIKVTAGGWNSDRQNPQIASADVKDYVVYERKIVIPADASNKVVKILFGGCNYGAEVFLDDPAGAPLVGKKVVEHDAPVTPFEADLTGSAMPGKTYILRVKAYSRYHYGNPPAVPAGFDFNKGMTKKYEGHTKYAYGLTGYVRLAIYPPVYISDIFVRPQAETQVLQYDVWVRNATAVARKIVLKGELLERMSPAAKRRKYSYPGISDKDLELPAGQTLKTTVEVAWDLGYDSYWWPNIPFSETYFASLHFLKLSLVEGNDYIYERQQRFGFVEYKEGPYYYLVNGVRFTSFGDSNSYGQIGEYDCWTETPCFQPAAAGTSGQARAGCIEVWKNYQRVGFNSMRLSTSVPTEYMMETADEAGFMLIPEGGSWGNGTCKFEKESFSKQLQETILACRNHPCVARYSMANESITGDGGDWRWLVDAAQEADGTRPYVFEVNPKKGTGPVKGMKNGHAYRMQHYDPVEKGSDHIRGMGECAWATDGMCDFAMQAVKMRMNDYAHFAPWSWLNFWPNFLEGMNAEKHPWKTNDYGDRKDSVDGWYSPVISVVQHALDPYLLVDAGLLKMNPVIKENSKSAKIEWPYEVPEYRAGSKIERKIEVFNGGLGGEDMELRWTARWDSPEGPEAAKGTVGPFKIEPGFHATQVLSLDAPNPDAKEKDLYLVLESVKDDSVVGQENRIRFKVTGK